MVITSDITISPFSTPVEERSNIRQALPQILAVCVKNVLLLGFGMTLGFPTILIPSLSGNNPDEPFHLGYEEISWIGSINLICVPVGCLLSGVLTQPIGRKRAMQLVNLPFLTAWLLFYFSTKIWHVYVALCLTGFSGGLLEAPTLTYVAEITQPSLRGILASTSTIAIITGILIQFLLGTFYHWKIVSLISIIVPFISFTLLFLVPESPHWLISKNRLTDGQKSLAWLRGWSTIDNQVENEFKDLCNQLLSHSKDNLKSNKMKNIHLFKKKNFLWPFGLVSFTFFLGHFSGMTTLQSYGVIIFSTFHTPIDYYYLTIILGVAQVFGCILSASLVHFVGKRPMNFFSLFGCGGSFLLAATYAYIYNINHFNMEIKLDVDYIWIPIVFLISAGFCTHAGIRILPWMLIGEVFPHEIRSTSSGLCGGLSYIFGFAANKLFLTMVAKLTLWGTFYIYSILAFLGLFILYFALPETEGKTLFQITEYFKGGPKLERCVGNSKSSIYIGHDNKGFESYKDIRESKM